MTDYSKLEKIVESNSDVIVDMADKIWEFAELGFQELKSSAYESAVLEKNGFEISDRGIGGLDTSWIATWGLVHRYWEYWSSLMRCPTLVTRQ